MNPAFQQKLAALSQAAVTRGVPKSEAQQTALAMIYGMIRRQAGMLSYNHIFWILGVAFLAVIPFLYLLRRGEGEAPAGMH